MQAGGANYRNARVHGLGLEILNNESAVVVGEQADVVGSIETDKYLAAQQGPDLVKDGLRQTIEIGEIIRDGEYAERAFAVSTRDGHGIAGEGCGEVNGQPVVVLET